MNLRSSNESTRHLNNSPCDVLSGLMAEARPITMDEACALRYLLFGNLKNTFSDAWTEQSFHFRSVPPYGFIQKKPGPCGVLAAVQAHVIQELLYGVSRIRNSDPGISKLKTSEKNEALARAMTSILWQAGDNKKAVVAKKHNSVVLNSPGASDILEPDGILECLQLIYFDCKSCLLEYYMNFISEMTTDNNPSSIFFLYSIIMTHGFEKFKEEMDCTDSHLIGSDGYCSQEVINLILTGKAVPNLFDGVVELNEGSEKTILQGIPRQSKIGFLSLYEYQENCTVGNFYKNPVFPIWLMLANSHYTVLFALSRKILRSKTSKDPFTLYHYNGIAKRYAETSYTINPTANTSTPPKDRSLPDAICCIYTRWTHASVEPIATTNENEDDKDNNNG